MMMIAITMIIMIITIIIIMITIIIAIIIIIMITRPKLAFGLQALVDCRDSKSGERGEHALAIFLPLLC